MKLNYNGAYDIKIKQQLKRIARDYDTPLMMKIEQNIKIINNFLDRQTLKKQSKILRTHMVDGDVDFLNILKRYNCKISFNTEDLFQINPIDPNGKYDLTMHQELKRLLNNLVKKNLLKELLTEVKVTHITQAEIQDIVVSNFYMWIENQQDKDALYSVMTYKYLTYYVKRLKKHNQEQANFLNGYDTLKSVKKEVQPALTVKEREANILNKKKTVKSKKQINDQITIYGKRAPFIITDPKYTAEQQTLIYTFIAIAQKKSLLNKDLIDKYLEWYQANEKSQDYRMIAPVERIIATYKERDFFEMVGLKLSNNWTKNRELINDWIQKADQTLEDIYNQPFYLRYIKKKGNQQNEVVLDFQLDINTAPYILNIKGLQYEIIQGYFNAKKEIDKLRDSSKRTALYDVINFKVKAITEYKNDEYSRKQITDFITAKAKNLRRNDVKEFQNLANDIINLISIKNNKLIEK